MSVLDAVLLAGLLYIAVDLVFAFTLRRCVMPGLKCGACRKEGFH